MNSNVIIIRLSSIVAAPEYSKCKEAAKACLQLSDNCGDLGNFRLCASFNCPPNIPFFPAAYHEEHKPNTGEDRPDRRAEPQVTLTVGLESGDLLFLAFHGVSGSEDSSSSSSSSGGGGGSSNPHLEGSDNLFDIMRQICTHVQSIMLTVCGWNIEDSNVYYGGIDASINPGIAYDMQNLADVLYVLVLTTLKPLHMARFGSTR